MRVPVPEPIAREISERAVFFAREDVAKRGWSSLTEASLEPYFEKGVVGIRSSRNHVLIQNRGFRAFTMWWAEGRVIPINGRLVYAKDVGKPGFVKVPSKVYPGVMVSQWREKRWRHPGLRAKRFLEDAIQAAIDESSDTLKERTIAALRGEKQNDDS